MKKMARETLKMGEKEPKRGQGRQNKVIKDVEETEIRITGWKDHSTL